MLPDVILTILGFILILIIMVVIIVVSIIGLASEGGKEVGAGMLVALLFLFPAVGMDMRISHSINLIKKMKMKPFIFFFLLFFFSTLLAFHGRFIFTVPKYQGGK